jgi:hypothetical protein
MTSQTEGCSDEKISPSFRCNHSIESPFSQFLFRMNYIPLAQTLRIGTQIIQRKFFFAQAPLSSSSTQCWGAVQVFLMDPAETYSATDATYAQNLRQIMV